MTLPKLPFWTRYALEADAAGAELALGRTLEPYHLLVRECCMTWQGAGWAMTEANRRQTERRVAFERRPSAVAGSHGQRVRYEP